MTYKTAQKLKEAKFPFLWNYEPQALAFREYPSLSELIEACGEGFDALGKCKDDGMSKIVDGWIAVDENNVRAWGATPEEAVASLFLRLNDKKTLDNTPPNKV